jgi:hypothetical protein
MDLLFTKSNLDCNNIVTILPWDAGENNWYTGRIIYKNPGFEGFWNSNSKTWSGKVTQMVKQEWCPELKPSATKNKMTSNPKTVTDCAILVKHISLSIKVKLKMLSIELNGSCQTHF